MDKDLFKLIDDKLAKFNPKICNGIAVTELKYCAEYIDSVMRCAAQSFPPELKYLGFVRCSTDEEVKFIIKRLTPHSTFELAKSSVYLIKLLFSFNGKELEPHYLSLPFVDNDGICYIHGSSFAIFPVLADDVFSVTSNNIFIQLHRAKITFYRLSHNFIVNNERKTAYVVYSTIYNLNNKKKKGRHSVKAMSTMTHYLFAKYGVSKTFKKFADTDVYVTTVEELDYNLYNPDEWYICRSNGIKPHTLSSRFYFSSNICLVVKKENYNFLVESMIAAFFYIVDHFTDRVKAEFIDENRLWVILLGKMLFGDEIQEGKLADDINNHLKSLDGYLDNDALRKLNNSNVYCENIYDLFSYINEKFSIKLTESVKNIATMYDKKLTILCYLLSDIVSSINILMFRLNSQSRKTLTENDVLMELKRHIKPDLIYRINNGHGEVSSISCSSDNKLTRYTCVVIPQTKTSGGGRNSRSAIGDPCNKLHMSIAEAGNIVTPGKSDPTGRGLLSPFIQIDAKGTIVRKEKFVQLLNKAQSEL